MRELKQKTQKKETYAEKTKKYEKENFEDNVPLEIGKRNLERNSEWQLCQETQSENCKMETQMKDKIKKKTQKRKPVRNLKKKTQKGNLLSQ